MKRLVAGFFCAWRRHAAARAYRHCTTRTLRIHAELEAAIVAEAMAATRLEALADAAAAALPVRPDELADAYVEPDFELRRKVAPALLIVYVGAVLIWVAL